MAESSDITIGEPAGAPAPAATEAPPAAAPAAVPEAAAPETDLFDDEKVETFSRDYVKKLRDEAAKHRTDKQRYEQAFKGWEPDDQEVWLTTIALANQNPDLAAAELSRIAALLKKDPDATPEQIAEAAAGPDGKGTKIEPEVITKADLDRILAERETAAATERALTEIKTEAKELGYAEGTPDFITLMWLAQNETKGDLKEAHKKIEARNQAIIDGFVQSKAAAADQPANAAGGGLSVDGSTPIKSISDASNALRAALDAQNPG